MTDFEIQALRELMGAMVVVATFLGVWCVL